MLTEEEKAAARTNLLRPHVAVAEERWNSTGFLNLKALGLEVAEWLGFRSLSDMKRALEMNPAWFERHVKGRP